MPTLDDEIERVLRLSGSGPMSALSITRVVAAAGYRKQDSSCVALEQIRARVSKHPERLERTPEGILGLVDA
jgi:hypothetical protein